MLSPVDQRGAPIPTIVFSKVHFFRLVVSEWERASRRAQMSEHSSPRPRHQYRRPSCMLFRRDATGRRLARPSFGRVEGAARNSSAVLSCSGGGSAARGLPKAGASRAVRDLKWPWLIRGIFFLASPPTSRKRGGLKPDYRSHKTSPRRNTRRSQATTTGAVTITAKRAFLEAKE